MTVRYRVTPRAYRDLLAIARYTMKIWGRAQRDAYLRDLENRFRWLADNPGLGRCRDDIHAGYYSYPQGVHVIFYVIRDGEVDIIGIPHRSMDVAGYFDSG